MAKTAESVLSFRLFGDFQWPPVEDEPHLTDQQSGLVEIWYVRVGGAGNPFKALLRWTPKSVVKLDAEPTPPALPTEEQNVFRNGFDPRSEFLAGDNKPVGQKTLWISPPESKASLGVKLLFRVITHDEIDGMKHFLAQVL